MIAARDLKNAARVRICALFYVLDPRAVYPESDMILGFARDRAGMAADTFAVIDDEPVFHAWNFSPRSDRS